MPREVSRVVGISYAPGPGKSLAVNIFHSISVFGLRGVSVQGKHKLTKRVQAIERGSALPRCVKFAVVLIEYWSNVIVAWPWGLQPLVYLPIDVCLGVCIGKLAPFHLS